MAESEPTSAPAVEKDDSEWEYEYHETETESFYVTLDISSAADYNKLPANKKKKLDSSPPKSSQPTTLPEAQDNAGPSEPPEAPVPETPASMDVDPNLEQVEEDTPLPGPNDRIQILDLHTQNPLISYRNQLYSCEWTSTLGTDILLTAPNPDFPHPVLREKPDVSVLATSSVKLMGRPAQLVSRLRAEEAQPSTTPAADTPLASAQPTNPDNPTPVKIPLGATPTRARQNQANFLERLMAIKAKKGEKDSVTVYTQKVNQGTGWRSQRKASEAFGEEEAEEAEAEKSTPKRGTATIGRPRGSRRTKGPRTAKGGLFRDYRPQLWDTPGADIRAGSTFTPESWDQLESGAGDDGRQTPVVTTAAASPLPTQPPAIQSTRPLSASSSPRPPSLPANGAGNPTPNPSPSLHLNSQPVTTASHNSVRSPSPRASDPDPNPDLESEPLQQRQPESTATEQSPPGSEAANGASRNPSKPVGGGGDVEMGDVG